MMLERSAAADLFRNTLSRIETAYGRLSYLASLRDTNTGVYRHHGLTAVFGREESARALLESHERIFSEWNQLSLEEKYWDLKNYLATLGEESSRVIRHWRRSRIYWSYVPASASEAENQLFSAELATLVEAMAGQATEASGGEPSDPDSSPLP